MEAFLTHLVDYAESYVVLFCWLTAPLALLGAKIFFEHYRLMVENTEGLSFSPSEPVVSIPRSLEVENTLANLNEIESPDEDVFREEEPALSASDEDSEGEVLASEESAIEEGEADSENPPEPKNRSFSSKPREKSSRDPFSRMAQGAKVTPDEVRSQEPTVHEDEPATLVDSKKDKSPSLDLANEPTESSDSESDELVQDQVDELIAAADSKQMDGPAVEETNKSDSESSEDSVSVEPKRKAG